jgi:hypothetical protein
MASSPTEGGLAMSVSPALDDLARARAAFDAWRAGRAVAGRIPEHLWMLGVASAHRRDRPQGTCIVTLRRRNFTEVSAETRETVVRSLEVLALTQVAHELRMPGAPLVKEVVFEIEEG